MNTLCENTLLKEVDALRAAATKALDPNLRRERGQYLTPLPVATFMASLFTKTPKEVNLVDAGAGTGILSCAAICHYLAQKQSPHSISVTAFELDPVLITFLRKTYDLCADECSRRKIHFEYRIIEEDFISYTTGIIGNEMFSAPGHSFNAAIVNPPYAKINSKSATRRFLRTVGIETSNLYTAFLSLLALTLEKNGELVAITPRSFCNGPYFKSFREQFLGAIALQQIHVFESRSAAFKDDSVLQENIITHGVKSSQQPKYLIISTSDGSANGKVYKHVCPYEEVVSPEDNDKVIHLATDDIQDGYRKQFSRFTYQLADLGLTVSTGRVVDFRARDYLRSAPGPDTVPLVYPGHFNGGFVAWPKLNGRKPNAIVHNVQTRDLLVPAGVYVLVKRFSSKEERRRVVACIYDPDRIPAERVGFENHLDYLHMQGNGLPMNLAKGLAAFLNSTLVDAFFRQFNGHTQVNASDLRRLRFPSRTELIRVGRHLGEKLPDQMTLDNLIRKELL